MIFDRAMGVADAILYEGYALYPYRPSSVKNHKRWMFGTLYPHAHVEAQAASEPWRLRCQCLVEAREDAEIEALARFLRLETRSGEGAPWEEVTAEEVRLGPLRVADLARETSRLRFSRDATRALGEDGITRESRAVEGAFEISATRLSPGIFRLTVIVANLTPVAKDASSDDARLRSLLSAQAMLRVRGGAFESLLDPRETLKEHASACENQGIWPVLVGAPGDRDLVLCSPIILADHPAIAKESPGDLFDGTEIDEILTLRILTLTDEEKREAAASDPRVRALLVRTEGLSPEEIARMHGAQRASGRARVRAGDRDVGPGDRVRLNPKGRSDIFDLALAGMTATIASIEQDYEDRVFVTVTIDADPGRDLGERGLPGHRFFFRPEEIEPLEGEVSG